MKNKNDIVALNDSQILRWICELNGIENLDYEVSKLKREIKFIKKQPKNKENKDKIKELLKWLGCEIEIMENDYDQKIEIIINKVNTTYP